MAGEALQNILKNRSAIRKIMSMDSNGSMNKIFENALTNGSVSMSEDGVVYNPKPTNNTPSQGNDLVLSEAAIKKSKLPPQVIESIRKTPLMAKPQTSVLDSLNLSSLNELREEKIPQAPTPQPSSTIDYSLLKTIINEAVHENVKRYMTALSKKLLTESANPVNDSNNIQALKFGDKFSFITENGDVYEATLKYKTNLNTETEKKAKK